MTALLGAVTVSFVAALAGLGLGRRFPRLVPLLGVGGALAAVGCAGYVLGLDVAGRLVPDAVSLDVVPTGTVPVEIAFRVDGLAAVTSTLVSSVALCVQVYSVGYMSKDPRRSSYTALISLFTAAMLLVVVADDLLVLLVGWEVMGICSYLLIGHHWEEGPARAGAVKAFLVTRTGDVGFLFGIFVLGTAAGTFRVSELQERAGSLSTTAATVGTLLVVLGVIGKSAQFPLHVWLPDAMPGPTPVSALIHAATMVAAGIILVARLYDVFLLAPVTLAVLGLLTALTMTGAAAFALVQRDVKRVLAWSTVSQLGYMLAAMAVGAYSAGLFHLLAHGAFKALLFLCAGVLIHAVGSNLVTAMGGLRRGMRLTFVATTLGLAALAGLPPLAGFFSKDAVVGAVYEASVHGGPMPTWAAWVMLVAAVVTVVLTGAYCMRLWLLVFFGPPAAVHPAPVPWSMRAPLVVLAVPTVLLGALAVTPDQVETWLSRDLTRGALAAEPTPLLHPGTIPVTVGLALLAVVWTYGEWYRLRRSDPAAALGRLRRPLAAELGVDPAYVRLVVRPVGELVRAVVGTDRHVVGAYVEGAGSTARWSGALLRLAQNGNVQWYLTVVTAGAVVMVVSAAVVAS